MPFFKIFSPEDCSASQAIPLDGYRRDEFIINEFNSTSVYIYGQTLSAEEQILASNNQLTARTCFTSQRLIMQNRGPNNYFGSQLSIDYDLIKNIQVSEGGWTFGQSYFVYNVQAEIYYGAQRICLHWYLHRPHLNAALIWWYWVRGVVTADKAVQLDYYINSIHQFNSCTSIIVPDDLRHNLSSTGVDLDVLKSSIGLVIVDNQPPFVDAEIFKVFYRSQVSSGNAGYRNQSSSGIKSSSPVTPSANSFSVERKVEENDNDLRSQVQVFRKGSNLFMGVDCRLFAWSLSVGESFKAGDKLLTVTWCDKTIPLFASEDGEIQHIRHAPGKNISKNEVVAAIRFSKPPKASASSLAINDSQTLYSNTESGHLPQLVPSNAEIPVGLQYVPDGIEGLKFCLANTNAAVQSFFNVLPIVGLAGNEVYLNDDSMLISPFDEVLYCQIIKENHKYSLAELYDQRADEIEKRGQRFKKWGTLGGIFLLSPLLPFIAYNQGKSSAPRGSRLDEIIPDPQLQFLQDRNSFLAMTKASGVLPRLRRMIFHKVDGPNGTYYRVIPAVVTQDSVIPCQVFSFNSTCFLRPVSAGIESDQKNYDSRRIHKQYYHLRLGGTSTDTGERLLIKGKDMDDQRFKVFRFSSDTRDLTYFYVDYPADPSHVF